MSKRNLSDKITKVKHQLVVLEAQIQLTRTTIVDFNSKLCALIGDYNSTKETLNKLENEKETAE